jgi:hypothetical protein
MLGGSCLGVLTSAAAAGRLPVRIQSHTLLAWCAGSWDVGTTHTPTYHVTSHSTIALLSERIIAYHSCTPTAVARGGLAGACAVMAAPTCSGTVPTAGRKEGVVAAAPMGQNKARGSSQALRPSLWIICVVSTNGYKTYCAPISLRSPLPTSCLAFNIPRCLVRRTPASSSSPYGGISSKEYLPVGGSTLLASPLQKSNLVVQCTRVNLKA